jgi:hypothetical protein
MRSSTHSGRVASYGGEEEEEKEDDEYDEHEEDIKRDF